MTSRSNVYATLAALSIVARCPARCCDVIDKPYVGCTEKSKHRSKRHLGIGPEMGTEWCWAPSQANRSLSYNPI
jgi:hypothetical protein